MSAAVHALQDALEPGEMPTTQLLELLHAHFIRPEDRLSEAGAGAVFLTEVTAPAGRRRADAVHVGLWRNRGAGEIDVCELKTARSDWRRELNNPAKAEEWWAHSTRFWVVAPSTAVVQPDEVPEGWGLMVPPKRGRRFRVIVKPEVREPRLTIDLLLTLIKNTETVRTNQLRRQHREMETKHYRQIQEVRKERPAADPDTVRKAAALEEFEKALGITLGSTSWQQEVEPRIAGEAMARFIRSEAAAADATADLRWRAASLEQAAKAATEAAATLRRVASRAGGGDA